MEDLLEGPATHGSSWSGVVLVTATVGPSSWLVKSMIRSVDMLLTCPKGRFHLGDTLTLLQFQACQHTNLTVLQATVASHWWTHHQWAPEHCTRVKEACSGVGALGFGLNRIGVQTVARNEAQQKTASVLGSHSAWRYLHQCHHPGPSPGRPEASRSCCRLLLPTFLAARRQ